MFCKKCGKEFNDGQKYCTNCGATSSDTKKQKVPTSFSATSVARKINVGKIIKILIGVAIIGWIVYANLDEGAITTNDEGVSSFDSGDSEQAIQQLKQASSDAVAGGTKMTTLENLGYVYSTEGQYDLALQSFKEALTYASKDSFDYFLISGEIALLEGKPNAAQISYNKAYQLRPNDFQINNALNLFYLDLEELAPYYVDYPKALQHAQKAYDVSDIKVKNTAKQNLAVAHLFNENYNQTISLLSSFDMDKEPHLALWLGFAYAGNNDVTNAEFYFRKAINSGIEVPQEVHDYLNSY